MKGFSDFIGKDWVQFVFYIGFIIAVFIGGTVFSAFLFLGFLVLGIFFLRFLIKLLKKPGRFTDNLWDELRDKRRDDLCAGLQSMGINAQMAERGRQEERIGSGSSLGLIDIPEGPIRWVNVTRGAIPEYGVPDSRLRTIISPKMEIESKVEGDNWQWKGEDSELGIIGRLNGDISIGYTLMRTKIPKVTIRAYNGYSCWVISSEAIGMPSQELWDCYQAIARHLLAEWSPVRRKEDRKPVPLEYTIDGSQIWESTYVCPECGSSNINKAIKRMPKSQQEIEAQGFKTEWHCLCLNCRYTWVEREKP